MSLDWSNNANVDLMVVTPDGRTAGGRRRTLDAPDGQTWTSSTIPPSVGRIDFDAGANCAADSLRRENLLFPEPPPSGAYRIHARLTSPCGATATTVRATLLQREALTDGTYTLRAVRTTLATLHATQTDTTGVGTYLFTVEF